LAQKIHNWLTIDSTKIEEPNIIPTLKPYTLPSRTKQTHKPKLVKEYGCSPYSGKPKQSTPKGKMHRHTTLSRIAKIPSKKASMTESFIEALNANFS